MLKLRSKQSTRWGMTLPFETQIYYSEYTTYRLTVRLLNKGRCSQYMFLLHSIFIGNVACANIMIFFRLFSSRKSVLPGNVSVYLCVDCNTQLVGKYTDAYAEHLILLHYDFPQFAGIFVAVIIVAHGYEADNRETEEIGTEGIQMNDPEFYFPSLLELKRYSGKMVISCALFSVCSRNGKYLTKSFLIASKRKY